jgi:ATP-dependent exoDNAse (exonuclease V) beta subunit
MEQLLDLAESFDARGEGGLSDFVRLARRERVEDPSRARVRVMTIHASKGLEFDAVVLPELGKRWTVAKGMVVSRRDDVFSAPSLLSLAGSEHLRACHDGLSEAYDQCLER